MRSSFATDRTPHRAIGPSALLHRFQRIKQRRFRSLLAAVPFALLAAMPSVAFGYGDNLLQGQPLFSGYSGADRLVSHNRLYTLVIQCDGNLVEYGPRGAVWHTGTGGHPCPTGPYGVDNRGQYMVELQASDGNLVVYDRSSYTYYPSAPARSHYQALWDSHTNELGNPSKFVYLRDDGHLVIERNQSPVGVVWDNTWDPQAVPTLNVGHYIGGLNVFHVTGQPLGIWERSGPGTQYPAVGTLGNGRAVSIVCQTTGSGVGANGRISYIWDRLGDGRYVSDWFIDTPVVGGYTPGLAVCS